MGYEYKVCVLNLPSEPSFCMVMGEDGKPEKKIKEVPMPSITGNNTELVPYSLEAALNRLGKDGWELVNFDDQSVFIFKR